MEAMAPPPLPAAALVPPPPLLEAADLAMLPADEEGVDHAQVPQEGAEAVENVEEDQPVKFRSSFYVQAMDEALDAVFEHEAFLFSEEEQAALRRWRGMDYQVCYLFMRLFLRKHGQWIRLAALRNSYTQTPTSEIPTAPPMERSRSSSSSFFSRPAASPSPATTPDEAPADSPMNEADGEGKKEKVVWPSDITDLDSACEELWRSVDFSPSASSPVTKPAEPVAGPSSPPPRPSTPPPHPPSSKKEPPASSAVLDLTLSDSDEDVKDGILDLTNSPVRPPRPPPRSANAKGKQPARLLPFQPSPTSLAQPAEPTRPIEEDLSRMAWSMEDLASEEPEQILGLLSGDELVALGKRMKVKVPTGRAMRADWTKALLKTSNQSTLSFFSALPPSTSSATKTKKKGESALLARSPSGTLGVGYDVKGQKLTQSSVAIKQALASIGPVIRLHPAYLRLFERVSLIYHRTSYTAVNTSALTSSLLARFGKRRYPSYTVSRSFSIFTSRDVLLRFERAVETEKQLEECLDGAWAAGVQQGRRKLGEKESKEEKLERYARGVKIWEDSAEKEWRELCQEAEVEMKQEEDDEEKRLLYYRRRFHPGWPLSRAAYKAAACYAKLGQHAREASILRHLLNQTSFRRGKRGDWYDRLALVLMKYPGTSSNAVENGWAEEEVKVEKKEEDEEDVKPKKRKNPVKKLGKKAKKEGGSDAGETGELEEDGGKAVERRARLLEALEVCKRGLDDPFTHLIYKSSLLRRIARLYSALSLGDPPDELTVDLLAKPKQRAMEGERVDTRTIGKKSVWRLSDGSEGTVEELCLEQYGKEGWKGFHSENGVLTMIFALVFWDIIFSPVDGVFETPYQSAPLDLATDAFAVVRRPNITARLEEVRDGKAQKYLGETDDRERPLGTWAVGTNWERFSKEDLLEIVECMGGPALASILTVFAEEYGHRTGGIPDLCLWNPTTHRVLFAEVKGPGDTLSETQKVWLDVLLAASSAAVAAGDGAVDVEVTRVAESKEGVSESDGEEDDGLRKRKKRAKRGGRGRSRSTSTAVAGGGGKQAKAEEIELDSD
ncbi:hypothetical protein JCM8547_001216 [Rhodosporidiobolus lusitaniae]